MYKLAFDVAGELSCRLKTNKAYCVAVLVKGEYLKADISTVGKNFLL
jgi:hypothetical protein